MSWGRKERCIEPPKLSGQDTADILAYLYTAHYFDPRASARRGANLVQDRGCTGCHAVRGKGGRAAADFATSTVVGTPASVVASMWNDGPRMEAAVPKQGVALPSLSGQELADISAFLNSLHKREAPKSVPK